MPENTIPALRDFPLQRHDDLKKRPARQWGNRHGSWRKKVCGIQQFISSI
ncbi:MAG: hypothetical protein AB1704_18055 [Pseudomonadota bacterium]|jgi:hypothetical protein|nr:hypothetical protein [Burkholderia sp. 4M9327F10]